MNKLDRYKILIRQMIKSGIISSQKELGQKMGYTNPSAFSQVINGKTKEPKLFTQRLKDIFPELNLDWLENGEGSLVVNENTTPSESRGEINLINNLAPNVFEDAVFECGFPVGESGAITQQNMNNVILLPNAPSDLLYVRAHGNSMVSRDTSLSIPDGSFVAIRKLKTNIIRWGEIYAIATRDGMVIKRLLPDKDNTEMVRCLSLNSEEYPEFELSKQDIIDIAIVVGVVTLQWIST